MTGYAFRIDKQAVRSLLPEAPSFVQDGEHSGARKYDAHNYVIFVDRRENTSITDARLTLNTSRVMS